MTAAELVIFLLVWFILTGLFFGFMLTRPPKHLRSKEDLNVK